MSNMMQSDIPESSLLALAGHEDLAREARQREAAQAAKASQEAKSQESQQSQVPPKSQENPDEMSLHVLELRARILGGSSVMFAIDRLACPTPGAKSAIRMKDAMLVLQTWCAKFDPEHRKAVLNIVGRHVKNAVEIMKSQRATEEASEEEGAAQ